jgi:hypothetical protein
MRAPFQGQFFLRFAIAAGSLMAGVILGIGSAYYAFSAAGVAEVPGQAGWQQRNLVAQSSALPYALGHYLAEGQLPPPQSVLDLTRGTSSDGAVLRGDCMVTLDGEIPSARWWTLAAINKDGLATGPRAVLSASSAVLESDGRIVVHVSTEPQSGNWIAPASGGTYALALTLHDPVLPLPVDVPFPTVTKDGC